VFYSSLRFIQTNPERFGLLKGQTILEREEQNLINKVDKLLDLPEDEDPTVATVTDASKLSEQVFFEKAQEGDKVLIYTNAKKVILYRPSEDRVVEVGTVNIDNQEGLEQEEAPLSFAILNSTQDTNIRVGLEEQINNLYPDAQIIQIGRTQSSYSESILVNVGNISQDTAQEVSDSLDIELGDLPSGESVDEGVDFVIIIGSDQES
jgi:hypothetical protein